MSGRAASLPAIAAEPDAPDALIGRAEAIRIAVQSQLSAKFTTASEAGRPNRALSSNSIRSPRPALLWVDENGLTERGKAVMAEIAKADEYGLRTADYALPKLDGFDAAATRP